MQSAGPPPVHSTSDVRCAVCTGIVVMSWAVSSSAVVYCGCLSAPHDRTLLSCIAAVCPHRTIALCCRIAVVCLRWMTALCCRVLPLSGCAVRLHSAVVCCRAAHRTELYLAAPDRAGWIGLSSCAALNRTARAIARCESAVGGRSPPPRQTFSGVQNHNRSSSLAPTDRHRSRAAVALLQPTNRPTPVFGVLSALDALCVGGKVVQRACVRRS